MGYRVDHYVESNNMVNCFLFGNCWKIIQELGKCSGCGGSGASATQQGVPRCGAYPLQTL